MTFTGDTSGVTAREFANQDNTSFTTSLDGSVQANDLVRYRKLRTFLETGKLDCDSLHLGPTQIVKLCAQAV